MSTGPPCPPPAAAGLKVRSDEGVQLERPQASGEGLVQGTLPHENLFFNNLGVFMQNGDEGGKKTEQGFQVFGEVREVKVSGEGEATRKKKTRKRR